MSRSDEIEPDICAFCNGTRQVCVGRSGLDSDGNAEILEPCEQCEQEWECAHDWHWVKDWYGDHNVVGGICDASRWTCRKCDAHNTTAPKSAMKDWEPDPDEMRERNRD